MTASAYTGARFPDGVLHVCFVMPPFEVYAPERGLALAIIAFEVTAVLRARGVETTVITPTDGSPLYPGGMVIGIDYDPGKPTRSLVSRLRGRAMRWDVPGYDSYVREVHGALRRLERPPDALVLFNDIVTGGLLERRHRRPVVTWLQNEVTTRHRLGHRSLEQTTGVLAVSSYIAQRCRENFGATGPPITVVPNAVNPTTFTPPADLAASTSPTLRTCFVGRIDPNKGPLLAAEAVNRARRRGIDVSIDIAGPVIAWGQAEETVDAYVAMLEESLASSGGTWVGQVSRADLPAFYQSHAITFVPSVAPEPFGLVALEAMGCGCAVIASDRGGLPEVCGGAAILIDPESPAAFDEALAALAEDAATLATSRAAARAHAEAHTWATTADRLLGVINGAS